MFFDTIAKATCIDAFSYDEAFRKAMIKGKMDRATAKKKAKRARKTWPETTKSDTTNLQHPSPAKSTYLLRLAMGNSSGCDNDIVKILVIIL